MAIVVTDNCQSCRFTECVSYCPVECFHIGVDMVYIDPGECIECRACIPVCPVSAIYDTDDLPDAKSQWVEINKEQSAVLPVVVGKQEPLQSAEGRKRELGF